MKLSNLNIFYIWLCFFFLSFSDAFVVVGRLRLHSRKDKKRPRNVVHTLNYGHDVTEAWRSPHKKNVLSCRSFIADILNSNFLYSHLLCPSEREVSLADIIDRGKHKFLFLIKFDKSFLFVSSDVSEMRLFMSFTLFVDMSRSIIVDES